MSGLQQLADVTASFTGLAEEHEDFRESVRSFVERVSPEDRVRRLMADERGHDPQVWRQMAEQLGLQGLALPERFGGSGASFLELGVVLEEMGRAVMCGPFFSTVVLAAGALLHCGDEQAQDDFLPGIAAGETIATVALTERSGSWWGEEVEARATKEDGIWRLTGVKSFVLDGHVADLLLVFARTGAGLSLFAVYGEAAGVTRRALPTVDQTRKQAVVEFDRTPARLIGAEGGARRVLGRVMDLAAAGLAAEQVGGAQRCLEMAVEYAKVRTQFGRQIGSFQAIKHRLADLWTGVSTARATARNAADALARDDAETELAVALAQAYCSDLAVLAAEEHLQLHGGIGMTWEHPAHLYLGRAKSAQLAFGTAERHRQRIGELVNLPTP